MVKILNYTSKLDYSVIAHMPSDETAPRVDFTGDDVYTGLARKLGLIDSPNTYPYLQASQVVDLSTCTLNYMRLVHFIWWV